jgi:hypothetical protein
VCDDDFCDLSADVQAEHKPMKRETVEIAATLSCLCLFEYAVWRTIPDITVELYVALLTPLLFAGFWKWPRHTWLQTGRLQEIERAWGSRLLEKRYSPSDRVAAVADEYHIRSFVLADWLEETSERMAREIQAALVYKLFVYLFALVYFIAMALEQEGPPSTVELVLKIGASLTIFALPLAWDYSRWRHQKNVNFEVRPPKAK